MKQKLARLVIDFKTKEDMVEWFEDVQDPAIGGFPTGAGIYHLDALDKFSITQANTFVVKRIGGRPEQMRMVLRKVTIEERAI